MKDEKHNVILNKIELLGRIGLLSALIMAFSAYLKNSDVIFYKSLLFFIIGTLAFAYVALVRNNLRNRKK
jgi:hypothetical protein